LKLLTHQDGVPYLTYVAAIKRNPIARKVKMADLRHNLDMTRLPEGSVNPKRETYLQALALLEG